MTKIQPTKPLIGIPTRTIKHNDGGPPSYGMRATFTRALERAGGVPILIPLDLAEETLRDLFIRLDGLMLAGGIDVHPKEYGEVVEPFCGEIDARRDAAELWLTRWALTKGTPVFGVCRGIQSLNVAAGGTLYQDIAAQLPNTLPHPHRPGDAYSRLTHPIEIEPRSSLAQALGAARLDVNSLHHQAIKQVAPNFRIVARAPDGIIEGIEKSNGQGSFALGVQFHPEWLIDDDARMLNLFQEFVRACLERDS